MTQANETDFHSRFHFSNFGMTDRINGLNFEGLYRLGFSKCGRINKVAALTGFSYEKMYGCFAGQKNTGRNNEMAVRRSSTALHKFIAIVCWQNPMWNCTVLSAHFLS